MRLAIGIYLLIMGFLGGVAYERMRFDQGRKAVLDHYNELVRKARAYQIELERGGGQR